MNLPFDSPFKAVLRSRNYLFLAPAPVFFVAPAPASFPAALYCHFKMYYSITVVTYEIFSFENVKSTLNTPHKYILIG